MEMPAARVAGDESEDENQPRIVLDLNRDFVLANSEPQTVFKLPEFNPRLQLPSGELIPCDGITFTFHPVPYPADVARAMEAMGHGEDGAWTATRFHAEENPAFMFQSRLMNSAKGDAYERFMIRRRFAPQFSSLKTMLIYTDGACVNNDSTKRKPRGGCAFLFNDDPDENESFALENKGPDGQSYPHTSNRAELRAVLAALLYRQWWSEGWERVVVVTDSEYVARGATERLRNWASRNWRTSSSRKKVTNLDLWRALSEVMGEHAKSGCEVSFWMVPREYNAQADADARGAAQHGESHEDYIEPCGALS
ncbi:ribonuclease H-like domain-containing protein [Hypoxylon fuscum]|nr:ribonuclease H-like domain-containing protein [Hypoxylon fuscum]